MENSPELDGKYLGTITSDFVKVARFLQEATYQVKVRNISNYPVVIMCKERPQIGKILIAKNAENQLAWNYSLSFIEEFVQRGLIKEQSLFEQTYKNIDEFCCVFVLEPQFMNFVYIPYPED
ncbi:MAG: hypothetical protein NZ551_06130 [Microscillaceae bacterium]|nr:hypothetical protein [Microscillaceae bacterium]MDW8460772.1 hypothetical protein [Cytophagales bacterium]